MSQIPMIFFFRNQRQQLYMRDGVKNPNNLKITKIKNVPNLFFIVLCLLLLIAVQIIAIVQIIAEQIIAKG